MSLIPSSSSLAPTGPTRSTRSQRVLSEEAYTDALSSLIKRDFFPDLERLQAENDYLEALQAIRDEADDGDEYDGVTPGSRGIRGSDDKEARLRAAIDRLVAIETRQANQQQQQQASIRAGSSRNPDPVASARSTRWANARAETPGLTPLVDRAWDAPTPRYPRRGVAADEPEASTSAVGGRKWDATPTASLHGDATLQTPRTVLDDEAAQEDDDDDVLDPRIDLTHHTLSSFQSSFTSEDNASFLSILSRAERARREKYSWAYDAVERENRKRTKGMERDEEDSRVGREMGRYWEAVGKVERKLIEEGEKREAIEAAPADTDQSKALVVSSKTSMGPPSAITTKAMALVPRPKRRRLSNEAEEDPERAVALDRPKEDTREPTFPSWKSRARNGLFFDPSEGVSTTDRRSSSLALHPSEIKGGATHAKSAFEDPSVATTSQGRLKPSTNFGATRLAEREDEDGDKVGGVTPSTPRSSRLEAAIAASDVLSSAGAESEAGEGGRASAVGPGIGMGGYDLLSPIPSPRPDMLGEERVRQLMTWGRIVGTPRAVGGGSGARGASSSTSAAGEEGNRTPAFSHPPRSRREDLAHRLAEQTSSSSRNRGGTTPRNDGGGLRGLTGRGGGGLTPRTPFGYEPGGGSVRGSVRGGAGVTLRAASKREREVSLSPAGRNLLERVGKGGLTPGRTPRAGTGITGKK